MSAEQFSYTFMPTGLGPAVTVRCSCGQELLLGDFLDHDSGQYDEEAHRILTEQDYKNKVFEKAVLQIMQMKSQRLFRIGFQCDRPFDLIYGIAASGISNYSDERIGKCILPRQKVGEMGELIDNYQGLDEVCKIAAFYDYFEDHVREELQKYDCKNEALLQIMEKLKRVNDNGI